MKGGFKERFTGEFKGGFKGEFKPPFKPNRKPFRFQVSAPFPPNPKGFRFGFNPAPLKTFAVILNPVQRRISVYRTTPLDRDIRTKIRRKLLYHSHRKKERTGMTQGPNAFRIPRRPKEDEDLRHSPWENKDTSNTALATPRIPPELKPTESIAWGR